MMISIRLSDRCCYATGTTSQAAQRAVCGAGAWGEPPAREFGPRSESAAAGPVVAAGGVGGAAAWR